MSCPRLDEGTQIQEDRPIDGGVNKARIGFSRAAENETLCREYEQIKAVMLGNGIHRYFSVDYSSAHICPICKLQCNISFLIKHLEIHSLNWPFFCDSCLRTYKTRSVLLTHLVSHSGYNSYKCLECDGKYCHEDRVKNHIARAHKKQVEYQCGQCEYTFKSNFELRRHRDYYHKLVLESKDKEDDDQNAVHNLNWHCNGIPRPPTDTLGDMDSQAKGEDESHRDVPSLSSYASDEHKEFPENDLLMSSQSDSNNVKIGESLYLEEVAFQSTQLLDTNHSECLMTKKDLDEEHCVVKGETFYCSSPEYQEEESLYHNSLDCQVIYISQDLLALRTEKDLKYPKNEENEETSNDSGSTESLKTHTSEDLMTLAEHQLMVNGFLRCFYCGEKFYQRLKLYLHLEIHEYEKRLLVANKRELPDVDHQYQNCMN